MFWYVPGHDNKMTLTKMKMTEDTGLSWKVDSSLEHVIVEVSMTSESC